jgi:formylglycine-generating enzyme required for sulfatase activity
MKRSIVFAWLCCLCAALPVAAKTAAPEGMASIPAGKFWMGRVHSYWRDALDTEPRAKLDDRPANLIYLDAFYLDKYEVTNADYARFLEATGGKPPWHWPQGKFPKGEERQAVYNVNWFEASAFCKWAGKRLPTEAEWEKAARGGKDRKTYAFTDEDTLDSDEKIPAAISRGKAMAVGSFPPNAYGLYDVIGNVMEWTNDWYDAHYYAFMPKTNPKGPETGLYKSLRGGGWSENVGEDGQLTTFYRNFSDPELRGLTIGLRCAK